MTSGRSSTDFCHGVAELYDSETDEEEVEGGKKGYGLQEQVILDVLWEISFSCVIMHSREFFLFFLAANRHGGDGLEYVRIEVLGVVGCVVCVHKE